MKVALVILSVMAMAWAGPQSSYSYRVSSAPTTRQPQYLSAPARYNYKWDINDQYSGNFYGQMEERNGGTTRGRYYVRLPDTRLMKVEYYADATGYHPTITYEGEAKYPDAHGQTYSRPVRVLSHAYRSGK
ncbi:pro-resilin-like isoform X2 [Penaeus japonicus]|uniref:pro-resilin-like isoform X2 n=1 Tax=Penaeus japonicus TaxID=27405 RepID=UPI001C7106A4|nr:pro-resilin-like isoform X2 [Penaeus japonicus]